MTREEASFILANIDRRVCDDELNEALDMAIKALEGKHYERAILIPNGATNGDIFLKNHPEVVATIIKKKGYLFNCVQLRNKEETIPFAEVYIDWWNALYKGGKKAR